MSIELQTTPDEKKPSPNNQKEPLKDIVLACQANGYDVDASDVDILKKIFKSASFFHEDHSKIPEELVLHILELEKDSIDKGKIPVRDLSLEQYQFQAYRHSAHPGAVAAVYSVAAARNLDLDASIFMLLFVSSRVRKVEEEYNSFYWLGFLIMITVLLFYAIFAYVESPPSASWYLYACGKSHAYLLKDNISQAIDGLETGCVYADQVNLYDHDFSYSLALSLLVVLGVFGVFLAALLRVKLRPALALLPFINFVFSPGIERGGILIIGDVKDAQGILHEAVYLKLALPISLIAFVWVSFCVWNRPEKRLTKIFWTLVALFSAFFFTYTFFLCFETTVLLPIFRIATYPNLYSWDSLLSSRSSTNNLSFTMTYLCMLILSGMTEILSWFATQPETITYEGRRFFKIQQSDNNEWLCTTLENMGYEPVSQCAIEKENAFARQIRALPSKASRNLMRH